MVKRCKVFFAILLVCSLLLTMGCYGRFPLTRTVYRINREAGEAVADGQKAQGVVSSVTMWVFLFLPVYSLATFGDAIIMNVIEFWTGEAIEIGATSQVLPSGDTVTWSTCADNPDKATLTYEKADGSTETFTLVRHDDGSIETLDEMGNTIAFDDLS